MSSARDGHAASVLVVDDHATFRHVACLLVSTTSGFVLAGEAASGHEALRLAARLRPDVVLLDIRMPEIDGIETAQRLLAAGADGLIVLTSVGDFPGHLVPRSNAATVAWTRKEQLSTRILRKLWSEHRARRAASSG